MIKKENNNEQQFIPHLKERVFLPWYNKILKFPIVWHCFFDEAFFLIVFK